jgi:hypothetical protein
MQFFRARTGHLLKIEIVHRELNKIQKSTNRGVGSKKERKRRKKEKHFTTTHKKLRRAKLW